MTRWYIGQPIVAIRSSSCFKIKKNKEYVIKGLIPCNCKCGGVLIDVGLLTDNNLEVFCYTCNIDLTDKTHVVWKHESLFAPIDFDISELTDILKQPLELQKK